jgi:Tol biopolymer transport system component
MASGESTNLTRHPARDTSPTWSPHGARIAFVTDRDGSKVVCEQWLVVSVIHCPLSTNH